MELFDILKSLPELTGPQLRHLARRVQETLEKDEVSSAIDKRAEQLKTCLYCGSKHIVRWGLSGGLQRYRCRSCSKTFNELTNTPLARLRQREKLATYAQCMVDGLTLRQAAKRTGISLPTAFRWRHMFLKQPELHKAKHLGGIVEVDETFFRESHKGKRTIKHRKPRHHGRFNKDEPEEHVPVLIMLDRYEREADFVLEAASIEQIRPCMQGRITPGSVLCTDGSMVYLKWADGEQVLHKRILSSNPSHTIEDGIYHIQTLNNYTARLKGWLRRFSGVGTAYLANYLAWWRAIAQESMTSRRDWITEALSV